MAVYPVVLFIVVLIAFQAETTRLKIRERNRKPKGKTESIREQHKDTTDVSKSNFANQGYNYSTS